MSRGPARVTAAVLWCAIAGGAWSCASGRVGRPATGASAEAPAAGSSWELLPDEELRSQRVVKLHYQGPDGDATLNLVLRLERPDRFSLQGNDQLGRSWFRLAVEESKALYLDLRGKTFCRFEEAIEIDAIPLGPLPFDQLPALLLGRLPVVPLERTATGGNAWRFRDGEGRQWTADVPDGRLERWTLWRDGEPEVWWHRDDSLSYLSARAQGLQLRWRTPRGQPLTRPPAPLEVPEGYAAGTDCPGSALARAG